MKLCDARLEPPRIPRTLAASPAYQPDWRFLVVEQHLFEIAKAEDKSVQLEAILVRECNPYRQNHSLSGQVAVFLPRNQRSTVRRSLMIPPDCGDHDAKIKQVGHGGNCSIALTISSREIVRPMESNEWLPSPLRKIVGKIRSPSRRVLVEKMLENLHQSGKTRLKFFFFASRSRP
jgi:hypothetical protein